MMSEHQEGKLIETTAIKIFTENQRQPRKSLFLVDMKRKMFSKILILKLADRHLKI